MKKCFLFSMMLSLFLKADLSWPVQDATTVEVLNKLPQRPFKESFQANGTGGRLDGVTLDDFKTGTAAFSFEGSFRRAAVSVRYEVNHEIYATTFFQRYRGDSAVWSQGGLHSNHALLGAGIINFNYDPIWRYQYVIPFGRDCDYVDGTLRRFSFPALIQLLKTGSVEIGVYNSEAKCVTKTIIKLVPEI